MKGYIRTIAAGLLAILFIAPAARSQEKEGYRLIEPERQEFNPHWFMQVQGGIGYTLGETNSFSEMLSPAAAISAGYRFSPLFGLRFDVSGWQAKGRWVHPGETFKYNYLQGGVDAMLSLTNLFCGYNANRTLDFYGFLGVGATYGFNNDDAVAINDSGRHLKKLWRGSQWFPAGRGGLGVNINLSKVVAINVEVNANMMPDKFNSKKGSAVDWQYNGLVGLTFKFGRSTKTIPAVYEQIVVEEPVVEEPQPEPAPAPVVEEKPAPKPQPMKQDVFFLINSSKVRQAELEKVAQLAEYMKANPGMKVTVTGYADKETGSSAYNLTLSERRAKAVASELEKLGIDPADIIVEAKGDTVQPFGAEAAKNRVAIALTK